MKRGLLLGIDIGTTGAKAVLVDGSGAVAAEAVTPYPMQTPRPGWTEQNPDDWWQSCVVSIRALLDEAGVDGTAVDAVGLSGQMHGLVLVDAAGTSLRPCIMWNDQRTAGQCAQIEHRVGRDRLIAVTGKPALTGFTAGKLLWVREHEPGVYERAAKMLLPKDFVRLRLTGVPGTDVADASGTNLLDVGRRAWSDEVLELLEVAPGLMPEAAESPEVTARVSEAGAAATGLLAGTPVVAGAGDQAAQSVGTGIVDEGISSVTIGTSGVVFAATGRCVVDPTGALHAYCHAAPGRWHLMGVTLAAGGSLRWLRDLLESDYATMDELAAGVAAGSEGLLYLPYLSGERTPRADPDARGVFCGLSLRHGRAHVIRSVLEGVAFSLKDCLELLCSLKVECGRVRVSGGGAGSALWRQVMADVFDLELVLVNVTQGAAFGAALLAGVGAGVFADVDSACRRAVRETGAVRPGPDAAAYGRFYERYRALYPALASEFRALARTLDTPG
ncbi:MAG: xylulokinase [bacterium]